MYISWTIKCLVTIIVEILDLALIQDFSKDRLYKIGPDPFLR